MLAWESLKDEDDHKSEYIIVKVKVLYDNVQEKLLDMTLSKKIDDLDEE